MKNELEILKAQVKALEELLMIKDKIIEALRAAPQQTVVYRYEYYNHPQYQQQWYQPGYLYQVYCGGMGATLQGQQAVQTGSNQGIGGGIAGLCTNGANIPNGQTVGLCAPVNEFPNMCISQWGNRS
jgi:hypothetical protein